MRPPEQLRSTCLFGSAESCFEILSKRFVLGFTIGFFVTKFIRLEVIVNKFQFTLNKNEKFNFKIKKLTNWWKLEILQENICARFGSNSSPNLNLNLPKIQHEQSPNPSSSHYINVPSNLTRPSSQSNTKCTRETIIPPRQRFTLPSSYPHRRRTPSKTSWFETYPPKSVIWIRNRDSPEEGRRKLAGQLIARESRARARIVCEDNHCETLQANIDAACYRNNGQTRRDNAMPRAYITLVPVFGQLHACATLHCARDSRERERERGESDHPRFLERVFFTTGAKGVSWRVFPSMAVLASRNGIPVLLAIFCVVAGAGTRTHVRREICLLARRVQSTAIVCGSVMAIGYGKQGGGWINFWLWVFCFRGSRDSWGIRDSGKYWESCDLASGELFIRRNLVQIYKYIVFLVTHIVVRYYLISFDSFFFFFWKSANSEKGWD